MRKSYPATWVAAVTAAVLTITSTLTLSSMTLGSVLFAGTGGLVSQDNANFFWDDTNNRLGIGTASPAYKLHVLNAGTPNSSTGAQAVLEDTTAFAANVGGKFLMRGKYDSAGNSTIAGMVSALKTNATDGDWGFDLGLFTRANGSGDVAEHLRVTGDGKVGIGASAPNSKLQVASDMATNAGTGFYGQIEATGSTSTAKRLSLGYNTTSNYGTIQALTNAEQFDPLLLNPNGGNVGIGTTTTSPLGKLQVSGDAAVIPGTGIYGQLEVTGATNKAKRLALAFNTTDDYAVLQAIENAIDYRPLVLNPAGGIVTVGANAAHSYNFGVAGTAVVMTHLDIKGAGLLAGYYGRIAHDDNNLTITTNGGDGHLLLTPAGNLGIATLSPASKVEIYQTPTDATGAMGDTTRLRISGDTTENLARGIDFTFGGTRIHSITSNASSGLLRILAADTARIEVSGAIQASTNPSVLLGNTTSTTGVAQAFTASSGSQIGVKLDHTINQTSTAAFDSLLINRVDTAVGSGAQNFINLTVSGTSLASIAKTGVAKFVGLGLNTTVNSANNLAFITAAGTYSSSTSVGGMVNLTNTNNTREALVIYSNNGATQSGLGQVRVTMADSGHDAGGIFIEETATNGGNFGIRMDGCPDIEFYSEISQTTPDGAFELAVPCAENVFQFNSRNAGDSAFETVAKYQQLEDGGLWSFLGAEGLSLSGTTTAGGTTGAQTIDKSTGSVNFAAAATSIVVTNSVAASTSRIFAVAATNDATCSVKNVVAASGSFTINMTAACTAETKVNFWVIGTN